MSDKSLKYALQGISLALLVYVLCSGPVHLLVAPAYAQQAPLFSVTLIASTGNPVRRQYASIITRNLIALGIDAKLFYVNFDVLSNRMFFSNVPAGSTFDKGGNDIGFIGWGPTSPVPDFSNWDSRSPGMLAPGGNNYALWKSDEGNAILNELYATNDPVKQADLGKQFMKLVYNDVPYNYIYEYKDLVPRDQKWTDFGQKDLYSPVLFPDIQHWSGGDSLTFAEASNVFPGNNLNPIKTTASNTFYASYIYAPIFSGSGILDIDSRDLSFTKAIGTDIGHSDDGLDWTVHFKSGVNFQDGVEVTADDFIYTTWAYTNLEGASTSAGSNIQYLGNVIDFTYLNGTTKTLDQSSGAPVTKGWWKSVDRYTFAFHIPAAYAFTYQNIVGYAAAPAGALPKHIMEQFPISTWDNQPFSTASSPQTYTWDTKQYGGSGSYTAVGPIGAGPYIMQSFDFTSNVATLKKWPGYWNATGLEAMGQFSIDTYKVVWIDSKDAALSALKNGEVNVLDNNYQLGGDDKPTLESMGVNPIETPDMGWQEMGFNLNHPVFGTGVDTPLGKSDPSKASEAARHVRKAISHLIPRDQIVSQLLGGFGYPIAVPFGPAYGLWYDPALKPDTFDLSAAADELRAAGYTVNLAPPPPIAFSGTPLLGGGVTISGTTGVSHMLVVIQQSSDGTTWTPIAAAIADNSTKYAVSVPGPPAFSGVMYRANFTGYTVNETLAYEPITPDLVNQYINNGDAFPGTAQYTTVTDPITVSSATNDALVVLAIIIVIAVIGALAYRRRRKK